MAFFGVQILRGVAPVAEATAIGGRPIFREVVQGIRRPAGCTRMYPVQPIFRQAAAGYRVEAAYAGRPASKYVRPAHVHHPSYRTAKMQKNFTMNTKCTKTEVAVRQVMRLMNAGPKATRNKRR